MGLLVRQVGWRPKGWLNPYRCKQDCSLCREAKQYQDFEAGADAMLAAINESMRCNCPRCTGIPDPYSEREDL